jgi:hypothetical protein
MKEKLLIAYLQGKRICRETWENFWTEEKGASDFVAILLIIVVLIAAAAIFKDQLIGVINDAFGAVSDSFTTLKQSSPQ